MDASVTSIRRLVQRLPQIRLLENMEERSVQVSPQTREREKTDPGSYRPICLLPVVSKLFKGVLLRLLKPTLEIRSSEAQYGSEKEDQRKMPSLDYNVAEEAEERYVMAIFMDIQSTFDSLWWPALMTELKQRDCLRNLYLIIRDYLTWRVAMMEDCYHIVERQAKRGCPQESILGPNFWNLVMDGLLRQLEELPNTQPIAHADDLVILIPGNSRRALEE
jgi:Reverse transcriptase (RNA-dependent DNA polymerase).